MLQPFARGDRARPWVYGHRGTRRGAPENTLRAMDLAIEQGADGIELDVRLCKSGEVIVLHDPGLKRVAGVPLLAAESSYQALAEHELGDGAHVPLLDEALSRVLEAGLRLNIELKADVPDADALVASVLRCVRARPPREHARVLFSSFDADICSALHRQAPELPVGFLCEHALEHGPDGMAAVHPSHALLAGAAVARAHAAGLVLNTWTVNDPARARKLASFGVDGIITDDVPAVLSALSKPGD